MVPQRNQSIMTLISRIQNKLFFLCCIAICGAWSNVAYAQSESGQVITVSPSLFSVTVDPGQPWQSALRVINSNNYELVVYPSVMDFVPSGEGGTGQLMPVLDEEMAGQTLADWIQVSSEPLRIPPQQSVSVPVTVIVPDEAAPGGHYAALVVSTRPPETELSAPTIQTAQVVTSLFFLTVDGEIVEQGSIREFGTEKSVFNRPEVDFNLRFENRGTVHIQPQGQINITNMWGQERGTIPINTQTSFGNVLPDSIRQFNFSWNGEFSLYDIGRYQAEVVLVYGSKARQTVTAQTYFWIIPLREIALGVTVYLGILVLLGWSIKIYIRRILRQSIPISSRPSVVVAPNTSPHPVDHPPTTAPAGKTSPRTLSRIIAFIYAKQLYVTLAAFLLGVIMTWLFVSDVLRSDTYYEVSIGGDRPVTLSAEDIAYQRLRSANPLTASSTRDVPVAIANLSGQAGLGAEARVALEDAGYEVTEVTTDTTTTLARTIILFTADYVSEAQALSEVLGGPLVSVVEAEGAATPPLQVRIGSDY